MQRVHVACARAEPAQLFAGDEFFYEQVQGGFRGNCSNCFGSATALGAGDPICIVMLSQVHPVAVCQGSVPHSMWMQK